MVDKNLFLYDLAIVAIFKDEGRYLKEWLDYHLLAGVEHFFLYNNDSSDDYKEILAPYVEKNLVTLTEWSGKTMMQCPAYEDAIDKYRFECRYMAFIDIDEFIFPKSNRSIVEVVDEILSGIPNAAGLGINWQVFGSNGQDRADYSRGVLERFTRRAPSNAGENARQANAYIKTLENPRFVRYRITPCFSFYFDRKTSVNSNGEHLQAEYRGKQILSNKIVINHYYVKSREEYFEKKMAKKYPCPGNTPYCKEHFNEYDRNEVFDDGILKYRAARAENFLLESNDARINRVISCLFRTLTQNSPTNLETLLTCWAVAEKFQIKIDNILAEEIALGRVHRTLTTNPIDRAEVQMLLKALPQILSRPFPLCKDLKKLTQDYLLPCFCEALKNRDDVNGLDDWKLRSDMLHMQKLLSLIK